MQESVENLVTLLEHGTLNRQQLIQGLLAALAPISAVANAHADTTTLKTSQIDAALEKLKSDFPESKPTLYRGEEIYFRDPDGILGQVSGMDYRGQRKMP